MAAHVLMVSPIPSHPQDQGNSARIHTVGRLLQSAGLIVHFLYYQMEGLTPAQLADMQACWDYVHPVPCLPRSMAPTGPGWYRLDDWTDPLVSEVAAGLHRRFRFRAVIANYVWFCDMLEVFGGDVVKILDTHDVFGGRAQRFIDAGLTPEWFHTTAAEEARGLARADIVLAIQDEEADQLRALGHPDVRVLGHMLGQRYRAPRKRSGGRLRVGYLASGNPLNTSSFSLMQQHLVSRRTQSALDFLVAGSICDRLETSVEPFQVLGRVEHVDDFYDRINLVVNPMTVGTGLKIKSVEAVFDGLPLIATVSAMNGLPAGHRLHALAGPEAVADCLVSETFNNALMTELLLASRRCAATYAGYVRHALINLVKSVSSDDKTVGRDGASAFLDRGGSTLRCNKITF